jgi:hypothetical protein
MSSSLQKKMFPVSLDSLKGLRDYVSAAAEQTAAASSLKI